ncbi:MAG: undecaprenyl-diphosphate phosphatase [Bacteroidota bacterium]
MNEIEALVLGIVQGLTEYLPVSSSGHLVVASSFMDVKDPDENLTFAVLVHAATALSSIIIFRKAIGSILRDLIQFRWNSGTQYVAMLAAAALPVVIVGLTFEAELSALFEGNVALVGAMWLVTGALLLFTLYVKKHDRRLNFQNTFIIGIAQAIAVLPGISRSGATIATALLMKIDKAEAARFSFLVVIVPILGKAALDLKDLLGGEAAASGAASGLSTGVALIGFSAAFVTGLAACQAMLSIVKRGKLHYFSIYCFALGILALLIGTNVISFGA